ncbi:Growth Factor Receptor-Bound Protein 14 [Manis pentadactyla]|nr:Growth Factor Receptor-Bound Protein 14 [Manis pentadactyla]
MWLWLLCPGKRPGSSVERLRLRVQVQHGKSKAQGDWDTGQVRLGGQVCSVDAALGLGLHHAAVPATLLLGRALCKELPGGTGISGDTIAASRDPAQWGATSQPRRLV